jgi:hypothetical protein
MKGLPGGAEVSGSFLKKRTKKLLFVRGFGGSTSNASEESKFFARFFLEKRRLLHSLNALAG